MSEKDHDDRLNSPTEGTGWRELLKDAVGFRSSSAFAEVWR